jgi:hypothetical protein
MPIHWCHCRLVNTGCLLLCDSVIFFSAVWLSLNICHPHRCRLIFPPTGKTVSLFPFSCKHSYCMCAHYFLLSSSWSTDQIHGFPSALIWWGYILRVYSQCWIFCNPSIHYAYQVYHHLNICSFVHQCNTFTSYFLLIVDMRECVTLMDKRTNIQC